MTNFIKLKVAEAHQDDVNKGTVRIDSSYMRMLGISTGDIIVIKGERESLAIVERAYPSDLGLEIIRMDGTLRKNAKISIGEYITISRAEVVEAVKVTLIPLQEFVVHPTTLNSLKKGLFKKPIVEGDIISVSGGPAGPDSKQMFSSKNPFAIDLFNAIERDFLGFNLGSMKFKVQTAKPGGLMIIGPQTIIEISQKSLDEESNQISYEDVGGLKSQLTKIRELVELPLKHPEIFARLGIDAPKGILLYGPPGTGKTLLARAIANESEASFYSINAPEVVNKFYGESEKKLRELYEKAEKNSPAIIFIDEIDAIAAKRDEVQGETEKRIVAQLLTLMDGLKKNKRIVVIAATNRPDALDEALRRPGRFDRELEIGVPKEDDRLEILKIHSRGMPIRGDITKIGIKRLLNEKIDTTISQLKKGIGKKDEKNKNNFEKELKLLENIRDKLSQDKKLSNNVLKTIFDYRIISKEEGKTNGNGSKKLHELMEKQELFDRIKSTEAKKEVKKTIKELSEIEILNEAFFEICETNDDAIDKLLKEIAGVTHGFVGADLEALVKEAAFDVLRKNFPMLNTTTDKIAPEVLNKLEININNFKEALKSVKPSAMREFLVEVPKVKWTQIGGLEEIKQSLTEMVEWPLSNAEAFKKLGIKAPKGILLYGPPGTGKTLLAKAVATETSSNFIYIKGPEIIGKYLGESEKMIRKIFEKARQNSPSILFFDEFDAIAGTRLGGNRGKSTDTIVNQILTEMDGIEDLINVKVIAATNRPNFIDPALLRPGRFDKLLLVDVPDIEARKAILRIYLKKTPVENSDEIVEDLAKKTQGYVGADLEAVVREAGLIALRKNINCSQIKKEDFVQALNIIKPSINTELQEHYQKVEQEMKNPKKELENLSMSSYM